MKTKRKVPVSKLSISVPVDFKPLIRQRAVTQGITVSKYIRRLVTTESQVKPLSVVFSNNHETTPFHRQDR
jgi:hypothetical protein